MLGIPAKTKINSVIDEIIDFIIREGDGRYSNINRDAMEEAITKHLEYGTCMIIRNSYRDICCVARWNWLSDTTAYILDLVIDRDYRSYKMVKYLIALGLNKNPNLKYICFKREGKYPYRDMVYYNIDKLLKRR